MAIDVSIHKGRVRVGDREAPLLSGAVHYWRLHPASWEQVLLSTKDMGLETIETYIPWEFHEIEKNAFDFTGETDSRRDLVGFLEMTREMGFWLVVRPGPYIYSEWVNMGVPTDVAGYHRLHEEFTSRASNYIRAVSEVLVPFQATQGGHIIMLQPDNETDSFEYCYEEQLGLSDEPGMFQDFLKDKYKDIEQLNRRWDATYEAFEKAKPIMSPVDLGPAYMARFLDFFKFRADYITRCVDFYGREFRRFGIDVPLMHNTYDILGVQDFKALSEVVDLVGVDAYPSNEFRSKVYMTGEEITHRRLMEIFRYFRTFSETTYIAEYESGIAHGLHYYSGILLPNHYTLTFLTAVQAGVHAWNWYMLVNRDNWMMCPINEWGRKQKEHFRIYEENVSLYKKMNVPDLEKSTDTSAFFYLDHQIQKEAGSDSSLVALYEAGIDYEFYSVDNGQIEKPLLFYAGLDWLPTSHQEKLAEYVDQGGNLVFFQTSPLYDQDWQKSNVLGIVRPASVPNEPFLDHLATETEVDLDGQTALTRAPFYVYDSDTPGVPIFGSRVDTDIFDTDFEENAYLRSLIIGRRYQVGYHEKRGSGTITVLGVRPTAQFTTAIHKYLGVPIHIYSHDPHVKPALLKGADAYYAVLVNLGDHDVHVPLDLAHHLISDGEYGAVSMREGFLVEDAKMDKGRFYVQLARKNGTVIKIQKK